MATVKIIHYTAKINTDGTSPVVIQVFDGKKYKRTIANVTVQQWDKAKLRVKPKSIPNYASVNITISDEYNRIEKLIIEKRFDVQRDFIGYFDKTTIQKPPELNFKGIATLYLRGLLVKSGWTYMTFKGIVDKFLRLIGNEEIYLRDIDERIVQKWLKAMQKDGNAESTIHNNVKVIKFVSEFGVRNKYDTRPEALHNVKVSPGAKTYKQRLTEAEFKTFRDYKLDEGTKKAEIRDMFLLAIYLRGVRISDVIQLKEAYFVGDRLRYDSQKTGKPFDMKLRPEALEIFSRYKTGSEYLFSFYNFTPNPDKTDEDNEIARVTLLKSITANINGKLQKIADDAGIKKKISSHIARHTFARMALDKIKDTNVTMDLLGHRSMKVHEAYIREITRTGELDDAADDIFG